MKRILTDAARLGCFPKDIKLLPGAGFIREPFYGLTPKQYAIERNKLMVVHH